MHCFHYRLGQINLQMKTLNSFRASHVLDSGSNTPEIDYLSVPNSPFIPVTPNASTLSISPNFSDRFTPDYDIIYDREPRKPIKRALRILYSDSESDCSISFSSKK